MATEIGVIRPGIATTLQDLGRKGYRAYGVPLSGALDREALQLANAIVGNAPDVAALEMLYSGVTVDVHGGSMRVALGGADAIVEDPAHGERPVPAWQSCTVRAGERLRVGAIKESAAAYLAIEGGFDIAPVMGSLSTYTRSRLGGWRGRALARGDALPLRFDDAKKRRERRLNPAPCFTAPDVLRVLRGPHDDRFTRRSIEAFLENAYTLTTASDRSGLRLSGAVLEHAGGYDLASEGIPTGSIQVPGSGLPVILIADHPTVGGYPRIATIIAADLAAAGRLRIGARVRFAAVTIEQAKATREARRREIDMFVSSIAEI